MIFLRIFLILSVYVNSFGGALVIPDYIFDKEAHLRKYSNLKESTSLKEKSMDDAPIFYVNDKNSIIPNEFIVIFRNNVNTNEIEFHLNYVRNILNTLPRSTFEVTEKPLLETFNIGGHVRGYLINLLDHKILDVVKSSSTIIELIEANSVVRNKKVLIQDNAPWGLSRMSQRNRIFIWNNQSYAYDSNVYGKDVNTYIMDTGIMTSHEDFEGRATWGVTTIFNDNDEDLNGHGTHCAGIIGSKTYGVAKNANLIAVKVLRSNGDGKMSDVIKGIEFVVNDHINNLKKNKLLKGSVANMSLGAAKSLVLAKVINAAVKSGVHFVVAAGNEDQDACDTSPADSEMAITVGATTTSDSRAFFSNWGKCVDIFAPGTSITSTYIGASNNKTNSLTGTSMSAPHVAGLVAYFLALQPESDSEFYNVVTPEQLKQKIVSFGSHNKLYNPGHESPNIVAYNGEGKDLTKFWKTSQNINEYIC